ncbi:rcc01693 family protein [Rhizobium sp. RU20A]|uniref:rcc01693 family protein n=1 Tax=Rhizobium sp. RU20A TaxID=1907412 RepID=UPI00122C93C1|nr:rcc01693 family protein [Rhizobium sp. RU20A]
MRAAAGDSGGARRAFPWDAALHHGFCLLRLSARDFWAMTPRELAASMGALAPRNACLSRGALTAMMAAFPDEAV